MNSILVVESCFEDTKIEENVTVIVGVGASDEECTVSRKTEEEIVSYRV